ncbi:ComEC/Rec2 family competence protein [Prevotella sp. RM4]|uniref:ComEC/Rec2 family competence protein n=1 Tax=Prevotella sp. RM4 TaxID=1200547 RepID=UPI00051AC900|nr:MBL fold metallo-hydrolase [Prevotella sp. RM4]
MAETQVELLKATYGDCIFININYGGKLFIIMIDGGPAYSYHHKERGRMKPGVLKDKLDELKNKGMTIDLMIITHVDEDHIGGIKAWFEHDFPTSDFVREIWINDDIEIEDVSNLQNTSAKAASFISMLREKGMPFCDKMVAGIAKSYDWGRIIVLAPSVTDHNVIAHDIEKNLKNADNENYSISIKDIMEADNKRDKVTPENDASIALLVQLNDGENDLFLGDANIYTVINAIKDDDRIEKPLHCKWVKLSHHGSKNNFDPKLLEYVNADRFIFSTDGSYYGHPDKEVLAHLVDKTDADFYFNYPERGRSMITNQDIVDYPQVLNRIKEI